MPAAPVRVADRGRRRRIALAVALILLVSAGVRLWHLSTPAEYMFDEVYYAKDAKAIVDGRVGTRGALRWEAGDEVSWPHPEVGKFAIAAGIIVFGDRAFGWRFPAVLAGLVILACVYPLARRLGLTPSWALIALLFAAADTLGIAQSRIATLDVFVGTWTVLCVLLALRYVQDGRQKRWLLLCGVAGGLALATKWSGGMALLAAGLVLIAAWWRDRRAAVVADPGDEPLAPVSAEPPSAGSAAGRRLFDGLVAALPALGALVLLPALLYFASYAQYFAKGHTLGDWWELQRQMYQFGLHLEAKHTYASVAPSWIIDYRPVWYYFTGTTQFRGVVAIGNPFLWWAATLALLVAPVLAVMRRTSLLLPATALVVVLYVPWFAASRTSFLYYMTPVAPFMAVLVATALAYFAGRSDWPRRGWLVVTGAALATAVLWDPVGRLAAWLFWSLPRHTGPAGGWVGVGVGAFLALVAVIVLVSPMLRSRRRLVAMLAAGAIIGIAVAFIPVVLAIPISREHFYHITWFRSWI